MKQRMFSILVPVYNVIKYLDECLQSLMNQSYEDFEIILVDDGSTDGSGAACDMWQSRYPERIRVIHKPNQGVMLARATAFREATGRYFVFVDSDDVLRADALQVLYGYIREHDPDMVIFDASRARDFSVPLKDFPFADGQCVNLRDSELLRNTLFGGFELSSLCVKCVRKEIVPIDLNYAQWAHVRAGEDYIISLFMLERAEKIVFSKEILYYYRTNLQSITNTYNKGLLRSFQTTLQVQREGAQRLAPDGSLETMVDRNALWCYYDVIAGICLSGIALPEKKQCIMEVISDPDFERVYGHIASLQESKMRVIVWLAKHRLFVPLYLLGFLKRLSK